MSEYGRARSEESEKSSANTNTQTDEKPFQKRGLRACIACRKGKNRCELDGDEQPPCRRCKAAKLDCVFDKPATKKRATSGATTRKKETSTEGASDERLSRVESELSGLRGDLAQLLHSMQGNIPPGPPKPLLPLASTSSNGPISAPSPFAVQHSASLNIQPSNAAYSSTRFDPSFPPLASSAQSQHHQQQSYFVPPPPPSLQQGAYSSSPYNHHQPSQHHPNNDHRRLPSIETINSPPRFSHQPPVDPYAAQALLPFSSSFVGSGPEAAGPSSRAYWPAGLERGGDREALEGNGVRWAASQEAGRGGGTYASSVSGSTPSTREGDGMLDRADERELERIRSLGRDRDRTARYDDEDEGRPRVFPVLPGYIPPPTHKHGTYGLVTSAPSPTAEEEDPDPSEDTLPRASLNAPNLALDLLSTAAIEERSLHLRDGNGGSLLSPLRALQPVKRKREKRPPNAFPDTVTKGKVSEGEARELYNIFFSGSHLFVPLFDAVYDTFESLRDRTPFTFDSMLAIGAKVRAGSSGPSASFRHCLENAQGIARSTLFGPVVRYEAVQAMLLLATHSENGWLPGGHALRMGLDIGLHMALDKLVAGSVPGRPPMTPKEERDLVVSSRIWLCLFWFDRLSSLGTARPIMMSDESSIQHARYLLSHPMTSNTDVRLVSQLELVVLKTRVYNHLNPLKGQVDRATLEYIRRVYEDLDDWHKEWDEIHRRNLAPESVLIRMLAAELYYAKLWVVCVTLRGVSWREMPSEQKEIALEAHGAATNCLEIMLKSEQFRVALRYSVHESLVQAAFCSVYLLKVVILFPESLDSEGAIRQVEELVGLFSEISAERYSSTLKVMVAQTKRRLHMTTSQHNNTPAATPNFSSTYFALPSAASAAPNDGTTTMLAADSWDSTLPGFEWPTGLEGFQETMIPDWLRDNSIADLGLPTDGADSILFPSELGAMVGDNSWNFLLDPSMVYGADTSPGGEAIAW